MSLYTIDLDSNDGIDIQDIRPFVILNTIAIADNIASKFISNKKEIKEKEIYNSINKYLNDITEKIFDDAYCIIDDNNIIIL